MASMERANKEGSANAWVMGSLAWLVPGLGHVAQGRAVKGLIGGMAVISMFITGAFIGGHIYSLQDTSEGLLSSLYGLCDIGTGLVYFAARMSGFALSEQPQRALSEYGSVFCVVAGLLNYTMPLAAFDLSAE